MTIKLLSERQGMSREECEVVSITRRYNREFWTVVLERLGREETHIFHHTGLSTCCPGWKRIAKDPWAEPQEQGDKK